MGWTGSEIGQRELHVRDTGVQERGIDAKVASTFGRPRSSNTGASSHRTRKLVASRPRSARDGIEERDAIRDHRRLGPHHGDPTVSGSHDPRHVAFVQRTGEEHRKPFLDRQRNAAECLEAHRGRRIRGVGSTPERSACSDHVVEHRTTPSGRGRRMRRTRRRATRPPLPTRHARPRGRRGWRRSSPGHRASATAR